MQYDNYIGCDAVDTYFATEADTILYIYMCMSWMSISLE